MDTYTESILGYTERTDVTGSLGNFQKYLTKIKTFFQKNKVMIKEYDYINKKHILKYPELYGTYNIEDELKKNDGECITNIKNGIKQIVESIKEYKNIQYDLIVLKTDIHKANTLNGIDTLLSLITLIQSELDYLRTLKKNNQKCDKESNLEAIQTKYNQLTLTQSYDIKSLLPNMNIVVFSDKEIDEKIQALQKKTRQLEDQRDELNNKIRITVSLSNYSVALLGL